MSETDVETLHRIYMEDGWNRFLPDGAIQLLTAIAFNDLTTEQLDTQLRESEHSPDGLDSAAWSPLEQYTDESLAQLRSIFNDTPLEQSDDEPESAEDLMAFEAAGRADEIAQMRRFTAHLGVPEVRTLGDLLAFIQAAGLVTQTNGTWKLNPASRLPDECLPLTVEQRKHEDQLRWALLQDHLVAEHHPALPARRHCSR